MRRLLAPTTLAVIAFAGCGDGGDEQGRAETVRTGQAIEVVGREYSFDPRTVAVKGAAGKPLELRLRNEGALAHNLRVFKGDAQLGGTTSFQGGKARSTTLTLERGSYRLVCTVGNHEQLGMHGTLEVE